MIEITDEILNLSKEKHAALFEKAESGKLENSINALNKVCKHFHYDFRFNSIIVIQDIVSVLKELSSDYALMDAYAQSYTQKISKEDRNRHVSVYVNRFSGNILYRVFSVLDKVSFCYVNYFVYKDLEEYWGNNWDAKLKNVVKFLEPDHPLKEGMEFRLELMRKDDWKQIQQLRHMEVHRLDPKTGLNPITTGFIANELLIRRLKKRRRMSMRQGTRRMKEASILLNTKRIGFKNI